MLSDAEVGDRTVSIGAFKPPILYHVPGARTLKATASMTADRTLRDLQTTIDGLASRNRDLERETRRLGSAVADLQSAFADANIAVVMLDNKHCIRSYNLAAATLGFHGAAIGQPFGGVALGGPDGGLQVALENALAYQRTIEREVDHPSSGRRLLFRFTPHRDDPEDSQTAGATMTISDRGPMSNGRAARIESEERFRMLLETVPTLLFVAAGDLTWRYVNPPFLAFTGLTEQQVTGLGWLDAVHPSDLADTRQAWESAIEAHTVIEFEARLRGADGTWRWFLIRGAPQYDADGTLTHVVGSCTDITERRRSEARQGVLLAELQHRVKNILAVVRSVLNRTLESSTDLEGFAAHLAGRIGALARTQTVAARTPERFVMLEELVHDELTSHGGQDDRQFRVEGEPVALPDRVASTLGLALHELTTNALKFGALSVSSGRVNVRWHVKSGPVEEVKGGLISILAIEWRETGVPLTDLRPTRRGFGRELIEQGLPYELGATTKLEFRPGGIRCAIELQLPADLVTTGASQGRTGQA